MDTRAGRRYLRMPGYPQVAAAAVTEMNRQVGPLRLGQDGLTRRGLLVRHLVLPGMLDETREILRFVAAELGTGTLCGPDGPVPPGRAGRQKPA
jgi:putative pyruvate formate lyase activating enzyme